MQAADRQLIVMQVAVCSAQCARCARCIVCRLLTGSSQAGERLATDRRHAVSRWLAGEPTGRKEMIGKTQATYTEIVKREVMNSLKRRLGMAFIVHKTQYRWQSNLRYSEKLNQRGKIVNSVS